MADKVPALHPDVEVIVREGKDKGPTYLLRSRQGTGLFALGPEEYFLFRQLDGKTSLETICERYRKQFGAPLSLEHLRSFIHQLQEEGFLDAEPTPEPSRRLANALDPENYIPVARVRLANPDRLLRRLHRLLGFCFWRPVQVLAALLIPLAAYTVVVRGGDLFNAFEASPPLLFFLMSLLAYCVIDSGRVLARGVALIHYGGQVLDLGVNFAYYLMPILYVDLTGIPWIREKRRRFWVCFIPIYLQILILSFSIVAWALSTPGSWMSTIWLVTAATPVFGLLLFNGNPLVKFDAYITLSVWTQIPLLRERALRAFAAWVRREPAPEAVTPRERRWFRVYGFLVPVYGFLHIAFLLILFGYKIIDALQGAGFIVSLCAVAYISQKPIGRFFARRTSVRWLLSKESGRLRWVARLALLGLLALILLIPYPYETGGPFNLLPENWADVPCQIDGGRIDRVFVREGERVTAGQPLAQIDQREYMRNVQATQAQLDNTEADLKLLRKRLAILAPPTSSNVQSTDQPPNIEQIAALEAEARRLQTLLVDYKRQLELTTLRAPIAGRISTPLIEQKEGQYIKKGDVFATVEQVGSVQVEIQVPEADIPLVRVGARVRAVLWAYYDRTFIGRVKEIAPIAVAPSGSTGATVTNANSVRVIAELPNPDALFKAKLTGYAKIKTQSLPVWLVFSRIVIRWLEVQFWYWLP